MSVNEMKGRGPDATGVGASSGHHIKHFRAADVIGERTEIYSLRPEQTVEVAAQRLKDWHVRTIAVTDDVGNVAGVFGQSDIASRVVAAGLDPKTLPLREVMTREPLCVDVETDLHTCVQIMRQNGISHIVLTRTTAEGEQYFGMISANDVLGVIARMGSEGTSWVQEFAGGSNA